MRAVIVKDGAGPADNLSIGEAPTPNPKTGEVLIKINAFGLNRMDISQREGKYPPPPGSSSILGVEFSGIIFDLGPSVSGWKVDDEVLGLTGGGAYAEYIRRLAFPKFFLQASTFLHPNLPSTYFLQAFQALSLIGDLKQNDNVLVHAGASGVGVAAIQLARVFGAKHIIATTSTQEKIDWLYKLDQKPTEVVNYKTEDFASVVKEVTENKGVNIIVDFVGQSHWNKNLDSLALDGIMVCLAFLSGANVSSTNIAPILYKRLRIQGSTLRSRSTEYQADLIKKFGDRTLELITGQGGNGPIKTYTRYAIVYPWTEIQDAHREMEANKDTGKIVVTVV
ncbi:hypothetical protein JOM56_010665 [Amanita muscaria]